MLLHGCCVTFGLFVEGLGGLLLLLLGAGSGQLSMFIGSTGGLSSALVRVMVVGPCQQECHCLVVVCIIICSCHCMWLLSPVIIVVHHCCIVFDHCCIDVVMVVVMLSSVGGSV